MPLLKKPAGPTKFDWNLDHFGTSGPITCEACGTNHPENQDGSYIISTFLGLQIVEQCCGAIIDKSYQSADEVFATRFLKEFAENPGDPRFKMFSSALESSLSEAEKRLNDKLREVETAKKAAQSIDGNALAWGARPESG
mgnify:FL=1